MINIILTFLLVCAGLLGALLGMALLACAIEKFFELQREEQIFIIGFIVVAVLITSFLVANNMGVPLPTHKNTNNSNTESINHSSTVIPVVKPVIPVTNPSTGMTTII